MIPSTIDASASLDKQNILLHRQRRLAFSVNRVTTREEKAFHLAEAFLSAPTSGQEAIAAHPGSCVFAV